VQAVLADSVRWTAGKQRLTGTRLHALLVAEGARVGRDVVKEAVAEWKRQRREVFVPLTYRPGDLAEVDFFEVFVDIDGTRRKAWLFLNAADVLRSRLRLDLRATGSNQFSSMGTSAPLVGGARTFDGAVRGLRRITCSKPVFVGPAKATNKSAARPSTSKRSCRFRAGRRWRPSTRRCWRRWMRGSTRSAMRAGRTISERFAEEQRQCRRAPTPFAPKRRRSRRSRRAPWCGSGRGVFGVDAVGRPRPRRTPRRHHRGRRGTRRPLRDASAEAVRRARDRHYLAELARKPQAVRQVLPDLLRDLGDPFPAIWDQLHGAHGPREAARHFAKVLGQLETHGAAVVVPALRVALATGVPLLLALTPAPVRIAIDALPATLRENRRRKWLRRRL